MQIQAIDESQLATNGDEYLALLRSDADWFARTADDLMQLREDGVGVFVKLPEADFRAFRASLEFKEGGLCTGSYRPLMFSLTLTDLFEVFERFGMSRDYVVRILEAKCEGSDWAFDFWSFCASNCAPVTL